MSLSFWKVLYSSNPFFTWGLNEGICQANNRRYYSCKNRYERKESL